MDIFTDASFNNDKKMAGIGIVFAWPSSEKRHLPHHTYFSTNNNETAELFAISTAINRAVSFSPASVRLFSDSLGSLRKIQRVFHYPNQRQIETIRDPSQKRILYNISASFTRMQDIFFSFHYIHGHQKKSAVLSGGYYNMLADQEASSGRLLGEMLLQSSSISTEEKKSLGRAEIDLQLPCWIVSPKRIFFHYEDLKTAEKQPKLVTHFWGRKKEMTIRRNRRMSSFCKR